MDTQMTAQVTFQKAIGILYKGVAMDLDDTATLGKRQIPEDAVALWSRLLARGVPLAIITARGWRGDVNGTGARMIEVLERLRAHWAVEGVAEPELMRRLGFLYLFPENGCYLIQGTDPDTPISLGLPSIAADAGFVAALKSLAGAHGVTDLGQKQYTITFRKVGAAQAQVRQAVETLIQATGVAATVSESEGSLEVSPAQGGKRFALAQFIARVREDYPGLELQEHQVCRLGDKGARSGVDHPLLAGGGFCVGPECDAEVMVAAAAIVGVSGWACTDLLFRQHLKFATDGTETGAN